MQRDKRVRAGPATGCVACTTHPCAGAEGPRHSVSSGHRQSPVIHCSWERGNVKTRASTPVGLSQWLGRDVAAPPAHHHHHHQRSPVGPGSGRWAVAVTHKGAVLWNGQGTRRRTLLQPGTKHCRVSGALCAVCVTKYPSLLAKPKATPTTAKLINPEKGLRGMRNRCSSRGWCGVQ